MSHHLVLAEGLGFCYPDGTRALEGIDFRIDHGEAVGESEL